MDEYGYTLPPGSLYKDILALIAEHSITMTDTENKDVLQQLIREELKIVQQTTEANQILIKAELAEIKKNSIKSIKSTKVTDIK